MIALKITKRAEGTQSSLNFSKELGAIASRASEAPCLWHDQGASESTSCPAPAGLSRIKAIDRTGQKAYSPYTRPTACFAHSLHQDSHQCTGLADSKSREEP